MSASSSIHTHHSAQDAGGSSSSTTHTMARFSSNFTDKTPAIAKARAIYFKVVMGGTFMVIVMIFALLSIFWGALWKIPERALNGWIVDFDGGLVGQTVLQELQTPAASAMVSWTVVPASQFPNGIADVAHAVVEEMTWVVVTINPSATSNLHAALASPNASYDGSLAITVFGAEARNENAFRNLISPSVQASLNQISLMFAYQIAPSLSSTSGVNVTSLLETSPQTLIQPIYYTIDNLVPFNVPVATAVTFVGLIYQLILSFFIVMVANAAREASGLNELLTTRSIVIIRFVSSFAIYFVVPLFYALLSLAFQMDFSHKFGHSGFLVFWMLNWVGMLAVGLALDSLLTLLTIRFLPFFMLTWIITNVSVCVFPIEVLPRVFRYGYAAPFYNVSKAVRTIVFGTKNEVGFNFGVLIVWIVISCITLPLIQWWVRLRASRGGEREVVQKKENVQRAEREPENEKEGFEA